MKRVPAIILIALAAAAATAVSFWLDPWAFRRLVYPAIYDQDWGRTLRVTGSLLIWLVLAAAVWLEARAREGPRARRAWLLFWAPTVAGGIGEILKLLIRRERPGLHEGRYGFRTFAERPFDSHDLGFPSTHAMVAFGGAAVLAHMYPRTAPLVYLLAAGCALSRVLAQAHFFSDVVAGAIAGWAVGAWLWRRFGARLSSTT